MQLSPFHYLPLTPGFFSILVCVLIVLFIGLVVLDLLRHAYLDLDVSPRTAMYLAPVVDSNHPPKSHSGNMLGHRELNAPYQPSTTLAHFERHGIPKSLFL